MESNRIWHEPEVIIYGNLVTPGIRSSAQAYDLANRRWYQLNVSAEIDDEDLMSSIMENHISTYYHTHRAMPPFNVIHTTLDGRLTTFESKPNNVIARPIKEKLHYDPNTTHAITTTSSDQLVDKVYLGRGVDRCLWRGRDCVFKRIEFDVDVEPIDREIKARERLIATMDSIHPEVYGDVMQQQFNVIPILAVVFKQASVNEVMGILMPFAGPSLASIFEYTPTLAEQPTRSTSIIITAAQLRDLARGVRDLARARVVHGDINDRNTLLSPHKLIASTEGCQESYRLVLIDLGSVAPEYQSDAVALGQLSVWCSERASQESAEHGKIEAAARILQETGDLDEAMHLLDNKLADGALTGRQISAEHD